MSIAITTGIATDEAYWQQACDCCTQSECTRPGNRISPRYDKNYLTGDDRCIMAFCRVYQIIPNRRNVESKVTVTKQGFGTKE